MYSIWMPVTRCRPNLSQLGGKYRHEPYEYTDVLIHQYCDIGKYILRYIETTIHGYYDQSRHWLMDTWIQWIRWINIDTWTLWHTDTWIHEAPRNIWISFRVQWKTVNKSAKCKTKSKVKVIGFRKKQRSKSRATVPVGNLKKLLVSPWW